MSIAMTLLDIYKNIIHVARRLAGSINIDIDYVRLILARVFEAHGELIYDTVCVDCGKAHVKSRKWRRLRRPVRRLKIALINTITILK